MRIQQRVNQLRRNLLYLGYYQFQIESIIEQAAACGENDECNTIRQKRVVEMLEKYERLGSEFILVYGK